MRLPFKHVRSGVRVNLDPRERDILVQLLGQLDELLDDGQAASADPLAAMTGLSDLDFGADLDFSALDEKAAGETVSPAGSSSSKISDPTGAPAEPVDPALARLLPEGNRDDPEAPAEFRRLTEFGLRARKRSGARLAADALGREAPVVLDQGEALALMKALTDVRLVLGERLELRTDEDAEQLHDRLWKNEGTDSWLATASIYEVLTSWQEYLIAAVTRRK